jgi:hypothetical protein
MVTGTFEVEGMTITWNPETGTFESDSFNPTPTQSIKNEENNSGQEQGNTLVDTDIEETPLSPVISPITGTTTDPTSVEYDPLLEATNLQNIPGGSGDDPYEDPDDKPINWDKPKDNRDEFKKKQDKDDWTAPTYTYTDKIVKDAQKSQVTDEDDDDKYGGTSITTAGSYGGYSGVKGGRAKGGLITKPKRKRTTKKK